MGSHTSNTGTCGELRIAAFLIERGYDVFKDMTGASAIDLIAHKNGQCVRIQVKTCSKPKRGVVGFRWNTPKSQRQDPSFDVLGIYVSDIDICLFMNVNELLDKSSVSLRIEPAKNGASKNIRSYNDYTSFEKSCGRGGEA